MTASLQAKQTVCLNMIVKDESAVIRRCLDSVKPLIDYWVIVDTGSKDGTQQIIQDYLKDIPGELHEKPWVDFGYNRTQALNFAKGKGDYVLIIDADDWLDYQPGYAFPVLTCDAYEITRGNVHFVYQTTQLIKNALPWRWVGVLHEYLTPDCFHQTGRLEGISYIQTVEGSRSQDPQKYWKHVQILQKALEKEPNNSRNVFYLAESYRDAGDYSEAIKTYQNRVNMGGWQEEIYWSLLQIAKMKKHLKEESDAIVEAFYRAHRARPSRPEALYYLAEHYNQIGRFDLAYSLIHSKIFIHPEADTLFKEQWTEDWGLDFQLSIAAYYLGYYQESLDLCDRVATVPHLPDYVSQQNDKNRYFSLEKGASSKKILADSIDETLESYYFLSHRCREEKHYAEAYLAAKQGARLLANSEIIPHVQWIHDYGMLWEFSLCAHSVGNFEEAIRLSEELLNCPSLNDRQKNQVRKNIFYYKAGIVVERFSQKKWEKPLAQNTIPKLHVCAIATHETPELKQLLHSCALQGITLNILGDGQPFSFGGKLRWVRDYLEKIPNHEIVMVIDAYDTLVLADEATILKKFQAYKTPFIISTETGCHPFPHYDAFYPASPTRFKYLNAGSYIGYAGYIKYLLDELAPIDDEIEDQGLLSALYLHQPYTMKLDYMADLFLSLYQVELNQIALEDRHVRSLETQTWPCVVHGNGPAKWLYQHIYDQMFKDQTPPQPHSSDK